MGYGRIDKEGSGAEGAMEGLIRRGQEWGGGGGYGGG